MTKRKPDKVIEYRFSMQDKEREMFDQFVHAHSFNSITTPIISLMNDVTGMIVFLSIIAATGMSGPAFTFVYNALTPDIGDILESFWQQRMEAHQKTREETGVSGPAAGDMSVSGIIYNLLNPNWSWFGPPPGAEGGGGGGGF